MVTTVTNAGRDLILDSGVPNTLYTALSSTTPAADGTNVTEPSGNGYARESTTMGAASAGVRSNTNALSFVAAGGDWGSMTYSVTYTALTGGTPVSFAPLTAARNMVDTAQLDIAVGDLDISATSV